MQHCAFVFRQYIQQDTSCRYLHALGLLAQLQALFQFGHSGHESADLVLLCGASTAAVGIHAGRDAGYSLAPPLDLLRMRLLSVSALRHLAKMVNAFILCPPCKSACADAFT